MRLGEFGSASIVGRTLVIMRAYWGGVGQRKSWCRPDRGKRRDLLPGFGKTKIDVLGTDVPDILNTWLPSAARPMSKAMIEAQARRIGWSLWIADRELET